MVTKPISVELGTRQQAILRQQLESGRYENASEVMNDALQLMRDRDAVFDLWLRDEVAGAMADKKPPVPMEDVMKGIEARHNRRMKAASRGGK